VQAGTYAGYKAWIDANRPAVDYAGRYYIASNVCLVECLKYGAIHVRLYSTDILTFLVGEYFSVDCGSYHTMTTVNRLNQFGPPGVSFWRYRNVVRCSRGEIGIGIFHPVYPPPAPEPEPEPVVHVTPRVVTAGRPRRRLIQI